MAPRLKWLTLLFLTWAVLIPQAAEAEDRAWSVAVSGFGGKAFLVNGNVDINCGDTCSGGSPFHGTARGVNHNDDGVFGAKITAWYLRKNYDWQPNIGLELDWTRFTADLDPQTQGAVGTVSTPGFQLGSFTFTQREFSVNTLAVNLLARYPIGVTASLPEGRWYPYVGIGGGVQRTTMTYVATGARETDYAPAFQALAGVKVFLFRNLAIFGEWKRTMATHSFGYNGTLGDRHDKWTVAANHVVGGLSLHF